MATQLNVTADPAARRQLALDAQAILPRDMPTVPLLSPRLRLTLSPRVQGFVYHPFDTYFVTHTLA